MSLRHVYAAAFTILQIAHLAKLPHCKLSPPHLRWLLPASTCGAIDSNISAADSVTISIRMIWLASPIGIGPRQSRQKGEETKLSDGPRRSFSLPLAVKQRRWS